MSALFVVWRNFITTSPQCSVFGCVFVDGFTVRETSDVHFLVNFITTPVMAVAQPGEVKACDASHVRNMNMNKEVATRLFRMLAVSEQTAATLKRDGASYARLNLLTQQMNLLQAQAQGTVEKSVAKAQAADGDLTLSASCTALSTDGCRPRRARNS